MLLGWAIDSSSSLGRYPVSSLVSQFSYLTMPALKNRKKDRIRVIGKILQKHKGMQTESKEPAEWNSTDSICIPEKITMDR